VAEGEKDLHGITMDFTPDLPSGYKDLFTVKVEPDLAPLLQYVEGEDNYQAFGKFPTFSEKNIKCTWPKE
jgi:hypothetical protein